MGSMAGAIARGLRPADQRLFARLRGALALAALALLVFLAIVFAARRLAGGFDQPLGGGELVFVAGLLGGVVIGIQRGLHTRTEYLVLSTQYLVLAVVTALVPATLLAALTLPGTSAWAAALSWFVVVGAALLGPLRIRRPVSRPADLAHAPDLDAPPENLVQQLTRQRDESGGETLHAMAEAEIPAGDRVAVLHLAFCPPLETAPQLTAHALDAEDAEVKITTAESYGVRLEVRLPKPAARPRRVLVEVLGRAGKPPAGYESL